MGDGIGRLQVDVPRVCDYYVVERLIALAEARKTYSNDHGVCIEDLRLLLDVVIQKVQLKCGGATMWRGLLCLLQAPSRSILFVNHGFAN